MAVSGIFRGVVGCEPVRRLHEDFQYQVKSEFDADILIK